MKHSSCKYRILLMMVGVVALLTVSCSDLQNDIELARLKEGFANPPRGARPKVYWWWLNGYVDSVRVKAELKAIKDAGLGGVDIFEIGLPPASNPDNIVPAGPAFMSEESLNMIRLAVEEAGKLDLEVGLGVASSWNAGGSWVEPKYAAKTLYASKVRVEGAKEVKIKLPFPMITPDRQGNPRKIEYLENGRPVYSEEVAVMAVPNGAKDLADTTDIIDVSEFFDADTEELTWKAPAGSWEVQRYICSNSGEQLARPSPNSLGPIIDHFDSSATRMHLMYFINRLKPLIGDFQKSALTNLYLASYEAKDFTWTPTLPAAFKKLNGYDIYKFIPAIYDVKLFNTNTTEDFNFDFSKTFSELMINNHYRKAKEICNAHGLKIISESGGPGHMHHIPVETLKALGALDIPRGEFWYNREYFKEDSIVDYIWLVKEIAAASHIYKRGIVEEEAFTSYWDWQEGPVNLKIIADRAFCEGMNRLVIHGFSHNPSEFGFPGIAYYAGTHYNDKQSWWPKVRAFNDYLSRISYILQETSFVADVLYYYGDKVPNLVPPKNTRFKVGDGYDYEVINTEILLTELIVENGELVLPGVGRYKILSIGNANSIHPDALVKLKTLAEQGATIVGQKPEKSSGLNHQPQATDEVMKTAKHLWETSGTDIHVKGKIFSQLTPADALKQLNVLPDFSYEDQQAGVLDYIHYAKGENDFYLIRNTTGQWISKTISFRQQNKAPELWNPVSGEAIPVSVYDMNESHVQLPLSVPPYGSYFVVFTNKKTSPVYNRITDENARIQHTSKGFHFLDKGTFEVGKESGPEKIESDLQTLIVGGEWQLTFPEKWGAPAAITFPALISWSESTNTGVRYFSGIGTYAKEFQFIAQPDGNNERVYLDLGDLAEVAEVWLNDQSLGITWTKPHRFDVTDIIKQGPNQLKVEVANTWSNRLTGDAITGEKFTNTNIVKANKNLTPWQDVPLKKSGLTGPVSLQILKTVQ